MKVALIQENGASIDKFQDSYSHEFVDSVDLYSDVSEAWFVLADNAFDIDLTTISLKCLYQLELAVIKNLPICVVYKRKSDGLVKIYYKTKPTVTSIQKERKRRITSSNVDVEEAFDKRYLLLT